MDPNAYKNQSPNNGVSPAPNPSIGGGSTLNSIPQQYNPQSSNNFSTPQTSAYEAGDIILSDKLKNTKKKAIIIIACLVAVISVVCAIIFLDFNSNKKVFNRYANLLLFGIESSEDIDGEYVWGYRYYARALDNIYSDSYNDYLDKLKTKYEHLYQNVAISDEYNDAFWLFYYTSYYPDISSSDVMSAKNDLSEQEIAQKVSEYYAPFLTANNAKVNEYGSYKIKTLTEGIHEEFDVPDYEITIFKNIWEMKGDM